MVFTYTIRSTTYKQLKPRILFWEELKVYNVYLKLKKLNLKIYSSILSKHDMVIKGRKIKQM